MPRTLMDEKKIVEEMYAGEAHEGALLFDQVKPGWWRLINTAKLQMRDCYQCVAGYVFEEEALRDQSETFLECPRTRSSPNLADSGFVWALTNIAELDSAVKATRYGLTSPGHVAGWLIEIEKRRAEAGEMLDTEGAQ